MKTTVLYLTALALTMTGAAQAKPTPYPNMAPIAQYLSANNQVEIGLARSAAPPSISAHAEVLVLASHGYVTATKGTNGFVCFVERSWETTFDDPQFWNPKVRSPNCFNARAVRTELPQVLQRTAWILAGASIPQMAARTKAAFASHTFKNPEPGAIAFMMSKRGYLNDQAAGPWLPHVMFFVTPGEDALWGANLDGSPIIGADGGAFGSTVYFVPVRHWSDGSPAPTPVALMHH